MRANSKQTQQRRRVNSHFLFKSEVVLLHKDTQQVLCDTKNRTSSPNLLEVIHQHPSSIKVDLFQTWCWFGSKGGHKGNVLLSHL